MVTEDCVAKDGPATPRRLAASPRGTPHWDAEDLGGIYSSYACMYHGYSVF
jgi:hypothetical protein